LSVNVNLRKTVKYVTRLPKSLRIKFEDRYGDGDGYKILSES